MPKSHTDEVGMVCWNDNLRGVAVALLLHRQNRIRSGAMTERQKGEEGEKKGVNQCWMR